MKNQSQKKAARRQPFSRKLPAGQLLIAGHFSLDTFDIEIYTAQELIVGDFVIFQESFAGVIDQRAFPNRKAAIF